MHRILHWLTVKLPRSIFTGQTEQRDSEQEERGASKEDKPGEPVTLSDVQTNSDDSIPDIDDEATGDTEPDGDTQPDLQIIDSPPRPPEITESFDPYNSGSFKALKK